MRTRILGTGLTLGLAITVFGGPVAWADNAESLQVPGNNAVTPFHVPEEPLASGRKIHIQGCCPDPEAGPPTSDARTGIEVLHDPQPGSANLSAEQTGSEPQLSLSALLLGLTVGAAAGAGAIAWREVRALSPVARRAASGTPDSPECRHGKTDR